MLNPFQNIMQLLGQKKIHIILRILTDHISKNKKNGKIGKFRSLRNFLNQEPNLDTFEREGEVCVSLTRTRPKGKQYIHSYAICFSKIKKYATQIVQIFVLHINQADK